MNETRQRFGDVATKLQAALALKDVFIQVVSSEQSGRFTKVTAKMSPSDIKWLIENKFTISKEIGSDSIRVVESDDGVVSIEVGLPFERWKDLSYHGRFRLSATPPPGAGNVKERVAAMPRFLPRAD